MTFTVGRGARVTNSGCRRVRQKPGPWVCDCDCTTGNDDCACKKPGYLIRCPDCKAERPS